MSKRQTKMKFKLYEKSSDQPARQLKGRVVEKDEGSFLEIYVEGYGEFEADDGQGSVVQLELWDGELRVLVRQNINCPDPTVLNMEMAREMGRRDTEE